MIKKIPVPMAGLMLALAILGNLLVVYGPMYRIFFGTIAVIAFSLITANIVAYPKIVLEGLEKPLIASTIPTFSMGIMILSTYVRPFFLQQLMAFGYQH